MRFEGRFQTDRQMQVSLIPIGVQISIRISRIVISVEWALGSLGAGIRRVLEKIESGRLEGLLIFDVADCHFLREVHEEFLFAIIHPFERFGEPPKLPAVFAASAPPGLAVGCWQLRGTYHLTVSEESV